MALPNPDSPRRISTPTGWTAFAASLILVSAGLRAQQPADNRAFTLSPHYAKGEILRYRTQSSLSMRFQAQDNTNGGLHLSSAFTTTLRYQVKEGKPDGSVAFSVLSEGGRMMDAADAITELPKDPDSRARTLSLDKQGRLVTFKDPARTGKANLMEGLSNQLNLLAQLHFLPLPDKPVKVGDTWSARYPLDDTKGDKNATDAPEGKIAMDDESAIVVNLSLLGVEKLDGIDTLRVQEELSVPSLTAVDAQGKPTDPKRASGRIRVLMTFKQVANLLPDNGRLLRSEGEIGGWVKFEGTAATLAPSSAMTLSGKLSALYMADDSSTKK